MTHKGNFDCATRNPFVSFIPGAKNSSKKPFCDGFAVLVLYLLASTQNTTAAHHWIPKRHEMNHNVRVGPPHILKQQPLSQKMRFEVVYDESIGELEEAKYGLITGKLIPEAVDYFHEAFSVRPTTMPIKLQRACKNNAYFLKNVTGSSFGDVQFCKLDCVNTMCGPVKVPADHLDQCRVCDEDGIRCFSLTGEKWAGGVGVEFRDFILYVSCIQTDHCNLANAVAYASYCQQERALDRPVAGFANICPNRLETDPRHYSNLLSTVKHEIFHALGFSAGLFAFYRDDNGAPYTPREKHGLPPYNEKYNLYQWSPKIVAKVERKKWATKRGYITHNVHMIVTPRVRTEVRKHFKCSSLEGAEIENQGGVGTEYTHWEKRLFENEAMTGTYTQDPVFSRITFALMEDTGWYRANYSMADELDWGKGLGCTFTESSCKTWMENHMRMKTSADPFCYTIKKTPLRMRCTHSKQSVALCNLRKYSGAIPEEYQYFNHLPISETNPDGPPSQDVVIRNTAAYGGAVPLADYCPFFQKFTLTGSDGVKRETTCTMPENSPAKSDNYALESYGPGCKCIEQGREWLAKKNILTRTMVDWGSGCYKFHCDGRLQVEVGGELYTCHSKGQRIDIFGSLNDWKINGSLICPSCEEFCGTNKSCPQELSSSSEGIVFVEGKTSTTAGNYAKSLRLSFVEIVEFCISRFALCIFLMICLVPGFH
ncbi:leishmanolysin-like peptidase isoform X1 [Montipora capricornis]|uniref:leishmanolysin-like peptidase isoform X1 n=1 Tax=Montipora capricornis TaxID=246305 RepID=UPI0035F21B6C